MPRLEQAIKNIVDVYSHYANKDCKLNKQDMKKMIENEIQNPELKAKICAGGERQTSDEDMDFDKFMNCLTCMAKCYYNLKTGKCPEGGK